MFINLTRRKRVTPAASLKNSMLEAFMPDVPTPVKARPPEEDPHALHSPYGFFYPANVQASVKLLESWQNPLENPEFQDREAFRQKKKNFLKANSALFDRYAKGNLATVHRGFLQLTNDDAELSRQCYNMALSSMGITDEDLMHRTFDLFDPHKEEIVPYREVISALDIILNSNNKHITCKDCFALLDPKGCGFILKPALKRIKVSSEEQDGVNHQMVKRLIEIIDIMHETSAGNAEKGKGKGKKKKKGKKDKKDKGSSVSHRDWLTLDSVIRPKTIWDVSPYKKVHLSFDEFCEWLATDALLVQAFLGRILQTMETVYKRNKRISTNLYVAAKNL